VARRGGAKRRAEELSAVRDVVYEDKWFRVATAVYAQVKRQFAEDAEAGEVVEAAERRLSGLRLEVVEAPLLKIEAAVDQDAAVRCRAALDVGVRRSLRARPRATSSKRRPTRQRMSNAEAAEKRR